MWRGRGGKFLWRVFRQSGTDQPRRQRYQEPYARPGSWGNEPVAETKGLSFYRQTENPNHRGQSEGKKNVNRATIGGTHEGIKKKKNRAKRGNRAVGTKAPQKSGQAGDEYRGEKRKGFHVNLDFEEPGAGRNAARRQK